MTEQITTEEEIIKITVEIPIQWKTDKESNNWTWKEVIGAGMLAKKDNPQLLKRINELETNVETLFIKLKTLSIKFDVAQELKTIQESVPAN